jgi:hypothetical protein
MSCKLACVVIWVLWDIEYKECNLYALLFALIELFWKGQPKKVIALYIKTHSRLIYTPEYCRAREIL